MPSEWPKGEQSQGSDRRANYSRPSLSPIVVQSPTSGTTYAASHGGGRENPCYDALQCTRGHTQTMAQRNALIIELLGNRIDEQSQKLLTLHHVHLKVEADVATSDQTVSKLRAEIRDLKGQIAKNKELQLQQQQSAIRATTQLQQPAGNGNGGTHGRQQKTCRFCSKRVGSDLKRHTRTKKCLEKQEQLGRMGMRGRGRNGRQ